MKLLDRYSNPLIIKEGEKYICVHVMNYTIFYKVGTVIMRLRTEHFTNRLVENHRDDTLRLSDGVSGFDGLWEIYAPSFDESLEDYM